MRLVTEMWQYGKRVSHSDAPLDDGTTVLKVKVVLGEDGTVSLTVDSEIARRAGAGEPPAPPNTEQGRG